MRAPLPHPWLFRRAHLRGFPPLATNPISNALPRSSCWGTTDRAYP
jgi:hypothetical protein